MHGNGFLMRHPPLFGFSYMIFSRSYVKRLVGPLSYLKYCILIEESLSPKRKFNAGSSKGNPCRSKRNLMLDPQRGFLATPRGNLTLDPRGGILAAQKEF